MTQHERRGNDVEEGEDMINIFGIGLPGGILSGLLSIAFGFYYRWRAEVHMTIGHWAVAGGMLFISAGAFYELIDDIIIPNETMWQALAAASMAIITLEVIALIVDEIKVRTPRLIDAAFDAAESVISNFRGK